VRAKIGRQTEVCRRSHTHTHTRARAVHTTKPQFYCHNERLVQTPATATVIGNRDGNRRTWTDSEWNMQSSCYSDQTDSNFNSDRTKQNPGARFTKYLTIILQLSYDNAKVMIDLGQTSINKNLTITVRQNYDKTIENLTINKLAVLR